MKIRPKPIIIFFAAVTSVLGEKTRQIRFAPPGKLFPRPTVSQITGQQWVVAEVGPSNWSIKIEGWLIKDETAGLLIVDWEGGEHSLLKPKPGEKRPSLKGTKDGIPFDHILKTDRSVAWKSLPEPYENKSRNFLRKGLPVNQTSGSAYEAVNARFHLADHIGEAARHAHLAMQFGLKTHTEELYHHALQALKEHRSRYNFGPDSEESLHLFVANRIASQKQLSAIMAGHHGVSRKELVKQWKSVASIPYHRFQKEAKAMLEHYQGLIAEDQLWVEPSPEELLKSSVEERAAYWIYHLRDLDMDQFSQPGSCSVFGDSFLGPIDNGKKKKPNPAIELEKLGLMVVPQLIALLDDARPTRCKGHWRNYWPEGHHLLRYQDAAIQILDRLLPVRFFNSGTEKYFSNAPPEIQKKTISSIRRWYAKSKGLSDKEKLWIAVEEPLGIYPLLDLLRELASDADQSERVLETLKKLAGERDPLQLPQLSELMCQLGDTSRLGDVGKTYFEGKFAVTTMLPDDSAPGTNAESYALRQIVIHGDESHRQQLREKYSLGKEPLSGNQEIFSILIDTVEANVPSLRTLAKKSDFPLDLLVQALPLKEEIHTISDGENRWKIRRCDHAVDTIQKFTGVDFGYLEKSSLAEKDHAIAIALKWWKKQESQSDLKKN